MYTSEECILNPFDVTRAEAQKEIEAHGVPFYEFVEEQGERDYYGSDQVLMFLGY
jgi:hypothetical protein